MGPLALPLVCRRPLPPVLRALIAYDMLTEAGRELGALAEQLNPDAAPDDLLALGHD